MKQLKIVVYAICKNEEKFVERWVNSMKEADEIYVLDTGSTDKTVDKLKNMGVNVTTKLISPWRFDVARNESLKLLPSDTDICVCTDLDEVFEPNWRKKLENSWVNNITRLRYTYNWSLDENNKPLVSFLIDKIHSLKSYSWIHPVHEVLQYSGSEEVYATNKEIVVNHYPDSAKPRSSYLPLLELSIKENPNNDRNMHYLGREYMYYKKWNKSIKTLKKHLKLKSATWKDERCASMRFIARCYINKKKYDKARFWLKKAIKEAPYLRDPYVEMALLEYEFSNWELVKFYSLEALKIKTHQMTYINEPFSWDHTIYDLLSLAYYYNHNYEESLKWINKAIELSPTNERLNKNKEIIQKECN